MAKIEVYHNRSFGFLLPLITIRGRVLYNDNYSAEGNSDMFSRWVFAGELRTESICFLPHSPNFKPPSFTDQKKIGN